MATDTADTNFSLDDLRCVKCGSELDTGFECNGCGFDMLPYVERLQAPSSEGSEK